VRPLLFPSSIGYCYTDHIEGVNGRLPNQDVFNTIAHVARYGGGVQTRVHDIDNEPEWLQRYPRLVKDYLLAGKHLVDHFYYNALGKPSGAHGVLAR
jgi:glycosylphosphatidylinositol transamidase